MRNNSIETLVGFLINEEDFTEWLNEFYLLWIEEDGERYF